LRPIAHAEDELKTNEEDGGVAEYNEDVFADVVTERIDGRVGERAGDEVEGEVEVGEGKERKEQRDELVDEFDVEEDLASDGVVGFPDLPEMDEGIDGSKEGSVKPAPAL
jgi:hypothetical protein